MAIKWKTKLETGIVSIDNQHKELIERINVFLAKIKEGKGKDEVLNTLNFLSDYVDHHFHDEEKYMKKFTYLSFDKHKKEHETFKKEIKNLAKSFESNFDDIDLLVRTVNNKNIDWFINHILNIDIKMAEYLKKLAQK